MGYGSQFKITIDPEAGIDLTVLGDIFNIILRKRRGFEFDAFVSSDGCLLTEPDLQWREWLDDLDDISARLPHLILTIERDGEESRDFERAAFCNGSHSVTKGEIVYRDADGDLLMSPMDPVVPDHYTITLRRGSAIVVRAPSLLQARQFAYAEFGRRAAPAVTLTTHEELAMNEILELDVEVLSQ